MVSNVTSLVQPHPGIQPKPADAKATQSKSQQNSNVTVQISNAAKALLKEATETPAQTAKEASAGDQQAKKLLAKEAAAAEAAEK
ncbi:MAG: hypothetical protein ACLQF0_13015 [Dissulfurispiraceae bacterium]